MTDTFPPPPDRTADDGASGNGRASRGRGTDRVPPHSLEAEVSVLGASLLSRNAASDVLELLNPEDFYRTAHRTVFEAVRELMHRGDAIDAVTLLDHLASNERLDEVGGATAVHDLVDAVPTAANAVHYARIVRQKAMLRRLIDAGSQITQLGFQESTDPRAALDRAESIMYQVSQTGISSEYAQLRDLLNESFERIEKLAENRSEVTGLATGFNDLDRLTAGLQPQNLVIIAARPSMGKCVSGTTRVVDRGTGAVRTVEELVEEGRCGKPVSVTALDDTWALTDVEPTEFHDNGTQKVVRVTTRLGRRIEVTPNHPFRTFTGWREIRDLEPGDAVAVPRSLPTFGSDERPAAEVKLLAYLLGDGCIRDGAPTVATATAEIAAELRACAPAFGCSVTATPKAGTDAETLAFQLAHERVTRDVVASLAGVSVHTVSAVTGEYPGVAAPTRARVITAIEQAGYTGRHPRNWLRARLEELDLWGRGSHDKFVPEVVFRVPREQVAMFLSRLYACDGSAWVAKEHGYFGISYASVSERLIRDVQHLLLRFGIIARIRERQVKYGDTRRRAFALEIRDAENCRRFIEEIGIFSKEEQCADVLAALERRDTPATNTDLLPIEVWDLILAEKGERSWADVSEATGRPRNHNWHVGKRRPSRRLLGELAAALDSERLRDLATSDVYWDEIVSIVPSGEEPVYDLTVPGLHNFVADDVVVHNSSLALGISHYVTGDLHEPTIIFSLEMSKHEIVNRLLASEAGIDTKRLQTGRLEDADWRKLGDALGKLSEAPLFIDDTPSITMMEIASKCRRLKQKHGLELVVVDYLQLMQSHERVENRVQEVAQISRGLKMLAKELDIPVIALSQLSRNPENRTDKRPILADLRESGCLTRETRLFRADTGEPVTFGQLLDRGLDDIPVWSTDADGRLVPGRLTHVFSSGTKPVYRVRLRSGLTVEASGNHPFRVLDGWAPLEDLAVGDRVAAARRLPSPASPARMNPDEIVLLAHLIGEGTTLARQPLHYTSADEGNLDAVEKAAWNRFGIRGRRKRDGRSAVTTQLYLPSPRHLTHGVRNPIAEWLDGLGVWDRRAPDKQVPTAVYRLSEDDLRLFLRHLFATDGCLWRRAEGQRGPRVRLYYATPSPTLASDVQILLMRLGIRSRIRVVEQRNSDRPQHHVRITGVDQQRRFLRHVGFHGERHRRVGPALQMLEGVTSNTNVDTIPVEIWERARAVRAESAMTERAFQADIGTNYCGTSLYKSAPSRERLERVADVLEDDGLATLASNDLFWDEIADIELIGEREVYDATVKGTHNFIAEGVVLHNSIEQDADVVGFIYRDEVYDEDSPEKGIAELIVAKHRNGPTGTVKLAFLGHLTKFANLARSSF